MKSIKNWALVLTLILGTAMVFNSCEKEPTVETTDYSKAENWYKIPEITKDVDLFYIPATNYTLSSYDLDAPNFAPLDNEEFRAGVAVEYDTQASAFMESTNIFVPYYRQSGLHYEESCWLQTGDMLNALTGIPYEDASAALDYYFKNYNNGRPFVIAGHSQGSAMTKLLLMKYFKEHPDYYQRMVAAYVIGYAVTSDDLAANPHLKFATGESDAGVIVSWNTEGQKNVDENAANMVLMPNAISINPLNWKLDDTYAPASENLGSYMTNPETLQNEITDVNADAQVNVARGVVVTNPQCDPNPLTFIFGPASYHDNDYALYYNNIKDNVAKRIATYKATH